MDLVVAIQLVEAQMETFNMKKYISLFIVAIISLFTINSFAYTAPPAPAKGGYVLDETGKLSQSDIDRLNRKIDNLKQNTKNEFGVAIIQSTGGDDIADVGQTIFRAWGIGNKQLNNGVLLVVALAERKTRIQTGKGAEGDLPDLKANDILQGTLKPLLKQGKFYEGIDATLDSISSSLDNRTKAVAQLPKQSSPSSSSSDNSGVAAFFILLMIGVCGIIGLAIYILTKRAQKEAEEYEKKRLRILDELKRPNHYYSHNHYNDSHKRSFTPSAPTPVPHKDNHPYIAPAIVAPIAATVITNKVKQMRKEEADRRKREEEANKRKREERNSSSSYSSSSYSSYDSGSSSSSYDSGSFGGFGGGDSGGGGSSGDF